MCFKTSHSGVSIRTLFNSFDFNKMSIRLKSNKKLIPFFFKGDCGFHSRQRPTKQLFRQLFCKAFSAQVFAKPKEKYGN